jgi:hypothetical protein
MTVKSVELFKIVAKRFIKSFLAGGFAGLVLQLSVSPAPVLTSLVELKTWGYTLVYAFIVGGLMALEKASQGYNPGK